MIKIARTASTVAALAALPLLLGGTANAESTIVNDAGDASASPTDITKVKVNHTATKVRVRIGFDDLAAGMANGSSSASIWFDTDKAAPGPDHVLGMPLFSGSDWGVSTTDGWNDDAGDPLSCRSHLTLDKAHDRAVVWVSRKCLGNPDQVRVSVKMVDTYDGSHVVRDWAPKRHGFTPWLAQG